MELFYRRDRIRVLGTLDWAKARSHTKSPPPWEDSSSTEVQIYFAGAGCCDGAAGAGAGAAGFELVVDPFTPESTDPEPGVVMLCRTAKIESVIDVTMNNTADQVVALERAVAAPRGPKAV